MGWVDKHDGIAVAVDGSAEIVVARFRVVVWKSLPELRKGWGDVGGKRVLLLRQARWVTIADDGNHESRELTAAPHIRPRPPPLPGSTPLDYSLVIIPDTCKAPKLRGVACLASCLAGSCRSFSRPRPAQRQNEGLQAANPSHPPRRLNPAPDIKRGPYELQTLLLPDDARIGTRPVRTTPQRWRADTTPE